MNRLKHETLANVVGAQCLTAAGLAAGTTTSKVKSANAVDYTIDGKIYEKAASDPLDTPTGSQQGNDTKALYLFSIDSGGTVSCTQSAIVGSSDSVEYPDLPSGEAPIGAIKVETDSNTTFTPGTTNLGASGVTTTYIDLNRVPTTTE